MFRRISQYGGTHFTTFGGRCPPFLFPASAHFGPCRDGVVHHQQVEALLALFGVDGGNQHALALLAHHLARGQVDNGHQGLADKLLRLIPFGDAGQNLPVSARAVVQGELQQLVGLLHVLAVLHLDGPEVGLAEGVEVHLLLQLGLDLNGGQGGLLGLLLDAVQLGQLLVHVDAGEQVLPLGDGHSSGEHAPPRGAVPCLAALAAASAGAQLVEDRVGGTGHEGDEQHSADAQGLQQIVEDGGQPGAVSVHILGQRPGGILVDILVGPLNDLENLLQFQNALEEV